MLQQPSGETIQFDYISPYNISEVSLYEPIAPTATATPNISSYRSAGEYNFYNVYSNYLDAGGDTGNASTMLRNSCWDRNTAGHKCNQCKVSCKYAYTTVCQTRGFPREMLNRAVLLCRHLCQAEFLGY